MCFNNSWIREQAPPSPQQRNRRNQRFLRSRIGGQVFSELRKTRCRSRRFHPKEFMVITFPGNESHIPPGGKGKSSSNRFKHIYIGWGYVSCFNRQEFMVAIFVDTHRRCENKVGKQPGPGENTPFWDVFIEDSWGPTWGIKRS